MSEAPFVNIDTLGIDVDGCELIVPVEFNFAHSVTLNVLDEDTGDAIVTHNKSVDEDQTEVEFRVEEMGDFELGAVAVHDQDGVLDTDEGVMMNFTPENCRDNGGGIGADTIILGAGLVIAGVGVASAMSNDEDD